MPNYSGELDTLFQGLADPTRRAVLERLSAGPAAVKELAAPFAMALPSFTQHLSVLEKGGLVRSRKLGRVRTYELNPARMGEAMHWLERQRAIWERRLDQLGTYLQTMDDEENGR